MKRRRGASGLVYGCLSGGSLPGGLGHEHGARGSPCMYVSRAHRPRSCFIQLIQQAREERKMPLRLPFRRPRRDECRRGLQHVCTRGTFVSQQKAFGLKTSERCLQYRPRTTSTEDSRILARTARHRTRASAHTAISPRGERGKICPICVICQREGPTSRARPRVHL